MKVDWEKLEWIRNDLNHYEKKALCQILANVLEEFGSDYALFQNAQNAHKALKRYADLRYTNLLNANLRDANLRNANLEGVKK